jgi:uncharacterized Zn-binding protein involved in type VI secretion
MARRVIVVGDRTTGGGEVLTGSPFTDINGMAVARVGDRASCPKHGGCFAIVTGDVTFLDEGQPMAREGDSLACGCRLLATRQSTVHLQSGGTPARSAATSPPEPQSGPVPMGFVAPGATATAAAPHRQDIELHYHYGDFDRTPVRGVGFQLTLADDSMHTGTLDDSGRARIPQVSVGAVQQVQLLFQPEQGDDDDSPILAARQRLKRALDAIVQRTRADLAPEWQQWERAGTLKRWSLLQGNQALGGAQGAWDYVVGTVETVVDMAVLVYTTDREIREWARLLLMGDQRRAGPAHRSAARGRRHRNGGRQ